MSDGEMCSQTRYLCLGHAMSLNTKTRERAFNLYKSGTSYASPTYEVLAYPSLATTDRTCDVQYDGGQHDEVYRWHVQDAYTSDIRPSQVEAS